MTRARLAVSLVFFLHGMAVGTWVSRIPAVQANLGLGEAALGLALLGAGPGSLLAMVPLAFGAAGRSRDMPAGPAIAAVATMGYLGFLLGPPTIGFAAEQVTLRGAFVLLLLLLGLIVRLATATGDRRLRPATADRGALSLVRQPSAVTSSARDDG